jgi:hypothetical protein
MKYIWVKNSRYYLFDTYNTWEEAHKVAMYNKKKNKSKFFILKYESGYLFPQTKYKLYLNKVFRLW